MPNEKILVVDDDKLTRWSLQQHLSRDGYRVLSVESGGEAMREIMDDIPDLILLDNKLPDVDGLEILEEIKKIDAGLVVIFMTAFGSVDTAVKAMKLGACDYISKPFNLDEMKITIQNALETTSLKKEVAKLRREQKERFGFDNIIGDSPEMRKVFQIVEKVAKSDATTILLQGESGTGKDLIAKAIHYQSARFDKPFMVIDCSALPETLLESELFGYERGAFTDAKTMKKGLLEIADGGTVFLDEIGDMKPTTQVKLLRVIEEKSFKRIGGTKDIKVNVRITAATNRDLEEVVRNREFREDLYYRLKVITIYLPPLRERRDDILALAKYFIDKFNKEFRRNVKGLSKEAERLLLEYSWPGNVRELKNAIERAIILGGEEQILPEQLPLELTRGLSSRGLSQPRIEIPPEGLSLEEVEKELVIQALEKTEGNQTRAAKLIGISRDALRYKMKKFELL